MLALLSTTMDGELLTRRKSMIVGGGIALFGILGYQMMESSEDDPLHQPPDAVKDTQFEWSDEPLEYQEDDEWFKSDYNSPDITVDGDKLQINGVLRYGSSTCNRIHVDELYIEGDQLTVGISWGEKESTPGYCTDDLDIGSYQLEISFRPPEIGTVVVNGSHREPHEDNGSYTVTKKASI